MKNLYNKVNIKNFGAKKIYVISKSGEHQRKSDFIKAWESFDGFEYEFVDAIMSDDIDKPRPTLDLESALPLFIL